MNRVTFTDPKTGTTFVWPHNPDYDALSAQPSQKQRQIDRTSSTANVGLVKQQGDDGAYIIHWEPLIWTKAHEQALWVWWQLCKLQTIHLTDVAGDVYEGQIITLSRALHGALGGPGDISTQGFYAKYVFEFEVYSFVSGMLADAGVSP